MLDNFTGPLVLLTAKDCAAPKSWIQIAYEGEWRGHRQGAFKFTREVLEQIVHNFKTHPRYDGNAGVVAFDLHHASEMPLQSNPEHTLAYAWACDLQVRPGKGGRNELWALTEYLEPARSWVKGKRIQGVSAAVVPNYVDPVTGDRIGPVLTSIAFTNQPFLHDLNPPVAASRSGIYPGGNPNRKEDSMSMQKVAEALQLSADANEEKILLAIKNLAEAHEKSEKAARESDVDAVIAAYRLDPRMRAALLSQRTHEADAFRRDYPMGAPPAGAVSGVALSQGAHQFSQQQPQAADPFSRIQMGPTGPRLGAPAGFAPARPGQVASNRIDLSATPGANLTQKAQNYLLAQPGGREMDPDLLWGQACVLIRTGQVFSNS